MQNTFSLEVKPEPVIFWQAALTLKVLWEQAAHFPVKSYMSASKVL